MMNNKITLYIRIILILVVIRCTKAGLWEWVIYGSDYNKEESVDKPKQVEDHSMGSSLGKLAKVPFEMRTADEKFLVEAAKFGLQASDLDLCHHRVIMHLKKTCGALTEEDIGKLSVQLLNCQSSVEGRKTFKCTEEMAIAQCTKDMDANTWNAYHIVSNRARAVCYAARQQQFTAKTEMTVNKLVYTSEHQIAALEKLEDGQNKVSEMTSKTLDTMVMGQKELAERQERLKASQQRIQTFVHGNLRELTREKALIAAGQRELAAMTEGIQKKLDEANKQLQLNEADRKINHQEILRDFAMVQLKTKEMWVKIDNSTQNILSQHLEAVTHYQETLQNLQRINNTVNYLLQLVDKTRDDVDAKLGWLSGLLGDAGDRLTIIYCCLIHGAYFMASAVTASFLNFPMFSRVAILVMVPLNAVSDMKQQSCLDFVSLTVFLLSTILLQWLISKIGLAFKAPPTIFKLCYKIHNSIKIYRERCSNEITVAAEKFKAQCEKRRSSMGFLANATEPSVNRSSLNGAAYKPSRRRSGGSLGPLPEDISVIPNADSFNHEEGPPTPDTSTPTNDPDKQNSNSHMNNGATNDLFNDFDAYQNIRGQSLTPTRRLRRISSSSTSTSTGRRFCSGVNKSGTPCKGSASIGYEFCHHHLHQE